MHAVNNGYKCPIGWSKWGGNTEICGSVVLVDQIFMGFNSTRFMAPYVKSSPGPEFHRL